MRLTFSRATRVLACVAIGLVPLFSAAAPKKVSNEGHSFFVDKVPAWVDTAVAPAASQSSGTRWHYLLRDRQVLAESVPQLHVRAIRRVDDASGLAEAASIEMDFEPSYQQLTIHELRVIRDGRSLERLDARAVKLLRREKRLEQGSYDGVVTASVIVNDVRVGDLIDYRFTVTGMNPVLEGKIATFFSQRAEKAATDTMRFRLVHPASRTIRVQVPDGVTLSEVASTRPGWKERIWTANGIGAWDYPADSPPALALTQVIQVTEYTDWAGVAAWARRLFPEANAADPAVRALAASLREKAPDTQGQVLAALDFVQREIRYFSIAFGESSHRPAPPARVLERRYGDCKDKSYLLVTLLRELGVSADPILVSQFARGAVSRFLPSPMAFDHVIVAATVDGETVWLDATRGRQTGPLASRAIRSLSEGLVLASDLPAGLAKAPKPSKAPLDIEAIDTFTVDSMAQPVRLASEVLYRGETGEMVRELLDRPEGTAFRESQFDFVTRHFGSSVVESNAVRVRELEDGVAVSREFRVADFFSYPEERFLAFEYGPWLIWEQMRPGLDGGRRYALELGPARNFAHRIHVRFAENVFSETAKFANSVEAAHFRSRIELAQAPGGIEHSTTAELLGDAVEREELAAHGAKVRDLFGKSSLTVKVGAISPAVGREITQRIDAITSGRVKSPVALDSAVQARSYVDDLLFTAHLDGGRLAPKNRAAALKRRGFARDYLGRSDDALADLVEARRLSPEDTSILVGHAEVLFGAGRFAEAADVLAAYPSRGDSRVPELLYKRGRIRFYLGDAAGAAEDFTADARESTGATRQYSLLWLYAATVAKGGDGAAAVRSIDRAEGGAWPDPILRHLLGEIDEPALIKAARRDDPSREKPQLCEAYFFVGLKKRLAGDVDGARRAFERSRATKVSEYLEYRTSGFELARLEKR